MWLVNRFGDVFAIFEDGSVHLLDLGNGHLLCVAKDRNDLCEKLDIGDNANNWLMIPLVDALLGAGMLLGPDQCYGFKIPPLLGGEYTVENISPIGLSEYYSFMAEICRQTKDLPDGTKVRLVIGTLPPTLMPSQ